MYQESPASPVAPADTKVDRYLTFVLGTELYGVPIRSAVEVIAMVPITPVPNVPPFIRGVINLRGVIVPVLDLRQKFKMSATEAHRENCIVIAKTDTGDGYIRMGMTVDSISDVATIADSSLEPVPELGVRVDTQFLLALGRDRANKIIMLLNLQKTLTCEEWSEVEAVAGIE